jgi:hypothetical protein
MKIFPLLGCYAALFGSLLPKFRHKTFFILIFDTHVSVHRNIFPNYGQQDATFLYLFIFADAVHVSDGSSVHHQEHITVHSASGIVNQYCC